MGALIVLGNGFDIYYKVKLKHKNEYYSTTFEDYAKFLKNEHKYKDWLLFCKSFLEVKESFLWGELENKIQEVINYLDEDGFNSKIDFILNNFPKIFQQKKKSFESFFSTSEIIYDKEIKELNFQKDDLIISFNYTTKILFEKFYSDKNFIKNNIFMVHGEINKEILVGGFTSEDLIRLSNRETKGLTTVSDNKIGGKYKTFLKNGWNNVEKMKKFIKLFLKKNNEKTFDNLYIIGLSLSDVDNHYYRYFNSLFTEHINPRYSIKEGRQDKNFLSSKRKAIFNLQKLFFSNNFHPVIDSVKVVLSNICIFSQSKSS